VFGIGNLEYPKPAVHPLLEPRRTQHGAENCGRNREYPAGSDEARVVLETEGREGYPWGKYEPVRLERQMFRRWFSDWWDQITARDGTAALLWGGLAVWAVVAHQSIWAAVCAFMSGNAYAEWWRLRKLRRSKN
jgi:hypothetical protein